MELPYEAFKILWNNTSLDDTFDCILSGGFRRAGKTYRVIDKYEEGNTLYLELLNTDTHLNVFKESDIDFFDYFDVDMSIFPLEMQLKYHVNNDEMVFNYLKYRKIGKDFIKFLDDYKKLGDL